jgi:hypothetical protein
MDKGTVQHKVEDNIEIARAAAPRFEHVSWTKEPHLRKLYTMSIFLLIASATTGYDGMLANTCQQMDLFKEYFSIKHGKVNEVFIWKDTEKGGEWTTDANKLGIMINMFNIGSILSFFITPYLADRLGRKPTIMIGCVIMVLGGCVSAFCNGYGSEYPWFLRWPVASRETSSTRKLTNVARQCGWLVDSSSVSATRSPRCARPSCLPRSATLSTVVPSPPSTTVSGTWAP